LHKNSNLDLCTFYICKEYTDDLLSNINELLGLNINIVIFNIFEESFPIDSVYIVNTSVENLKNEIIKYKDKVRNNFLLILDDTEKVIINPSLNKNELLNQPFFNIEIYPDKDKVFDYEIEVFKSREIRLFNLKNKITEDFIKNFNLINCSTYTLPKENIYILKKEYKTDIDLLKLNENDNLFKGIYYFYNNSIKSEEFLKLENEKYQSKLILIKQYILKNDIENAKKIAYDNFDLLKEYSTFYFYLAEINFKEKKYKEVVSNINKGFKINRIEEPYLISDNKWKPYLLIGKSLFYLSKYLNSKRFLEKSLDLIENRRAPEVLFYLAKVFFQIKKYDQVIKYVYEIINTEKVNKFILQEIKYLFFNLLTYIDIDDKVVNILKNDLFDDKYHILRIADTNYMNEDYQKALQLYLFVKEKFKNQTKELVFKIAYVFAKLKLLKEATIYFEKYLEYEPNNLDVLNNLAFIYLNLEKLDIAEKICLRILEINNFSFEAYLYLSLIYLSKEDKIKAKFYIDKAKTINPVSPEIIKLFQIFKSTFNE